MNAVLALAGLGLMLAAQAADNAPACLMVRLAAGQPPLCVVRTVERQQLQIAVRDAAGRVLAQACFPSWHERATVARTTVLGPGTEQLAVDFEGNTGSGVHQTLRAILRLDQGALKPVLLETVAYDMDGAGTQQRLKVTPTATPAADGKPVLALSFAHLLDEGRPQRSRWSDTLRWNEANGSFYDRATEQQRAQKAPSALRRNIAKARLAALALGNANLCEAGVIEKTGLFEILADEPQPATAAPGYTVSAQQLQAVVASRFPLRYPVPGFIDFALQAPVLRLLPTQNRLGAELALQASGPALNQPREGLLDVDFALRYEPADQTIRAHQLRVNTLRLQGLTAQAQALIDTYRPLLAGQALGEVVLHRLRPQDLALADVMGLEPGAITVTPAGLVVGFVGKRGRVP